MKPGDWDGRPVAEVLPIDRMGEGFGIVHAETEGGSMIYRDIYCGDHSELVIECGNGAVYAIRDLSWWRFADDNSTEGGQ